MQIAAIGSNQLLTATAAAPRPSAAPIAPASDDARVERTPAFRLYKQISGDLFRLPGVTSLRIAGPWSPNELGIEVADERYAALLTSVVESVIDDVNLRIYIGREREPYAGGPSQSLHDHIVAVNALPGVWKHTAVLQNRGSGSVIFHTIDDATSTRLDRILRNRWHLGEDRNGYGIYVGVQWKGGVPAPRA